MIQRPKGILIPEGELSKMMGKQVHVFGYRWGCTWHLIEVNGRSATLQTPKTKRRITMDIGKLCYTKKYEPKQ